MSQRGARRVGARSRRRETPRGGLEKLERERGMAAGNSSWPPAWPARAAWEGARSRGFATFRRPMFSRLFAVWLTVLGTSAQAQQGDDPSEEAAATNSAAARALFAEGLTAAEAGDHAAAADRFERALELRWAAPIAYNFAEALSRMGRLVEAIENLHAIERSEASLDVKETARARREELEPSVGRLRVVLTPDEPGLSIRVDGRPLPQALRGVAFPVDPGERRLTIHRGAQEAGVAQSTVVAGVETTVHVEVAPRLPTPEELAAEEERRRSVEEAERRRLEEQRRVREEARARAAAVRRRRRLGGALGAAALVVLGAAVVGVTVALRPQADPRLEGNFDPPRIQGRVEGVTP